MAAWNMKKSKGLFHQSGTQTVWLSFSCSRLNIGPLSRRWCRPLRWVVYPQQRNPTESAAPPWSEKMNKHPFFRRFNERTFKGAKKPPYVLSCQHINASLLLVFLQAISKKSGWKDKRKQTHVHVFLGFFFTAIIGVISLAASGIRRIIAVIHVDCIILECVVLQAFRASLSILVHYRIWFAEKNAQNLNTTPNIPSDPSGKNAQMWWDKSNLSRIVS